jgi:hypothetical protein
VLAGQLIWNMAGSFAHNHKISHDRFSGFWVRLELVKGHVSDKLLNFRNCIKDVKDTFPGWYHIVS